MLEPLQTNHQPIRFPCPEGAPYRACDLLNTGDAHAGTSIVKLGLRARTELPASHNGMLSGDVEN
jgi:hypothetical protein